MSPHRAKGWYALAIAAAVVALVPTSASASPPARAAAGARTATTTQAAAVTPNAVTPSAVTPSAVTPNAVTPNAIPAPPAGFTTTWSDDFSGASGTGLDTGTWKYDTGPGSSFGTGEIETMTSSTANVFQDGAGHLVLKALHSGTDPNSGWTS